MIDPLTALVIIAPAVILPLAMKVTDAVGGLFKKKESDAKPDLCTGFVEEQHGKTISRDDCTALRSPMCSDGRCSFHCSKLCRCDKADLR